MNSKTSFKRFLCKFIHRRLRSEEFWLVTTDKVPIWLRSWKMTIKTLYHVWYGVRARNSIGMYQLTNLLFPYRHKWDISINSKSNNIKPICMSPIFSVDTMTVMLWISGRRDALSMFVFTKVVSCSTRAFNGTGKSLLWAALIWQWKCMRKIFYSIALVVFQPREESNGFVRGVSSSGKSL